MAESMSVEISVLRFNTLNIIKITKITTHSLFLVRFISKERKLPADKEKAVAECCLGILYLEGQYGIKRDEKVAVQWFSRATQHGDMEAKNLREGCQWWELGRHLM
jgi:hypothetical protein